MPSGVAGVRVHDDRCVTAAVAGGATSASTPARRARYTALAGIPQRGGPRTISASPQAASSALRSSGASGTSRSGRARPDRARACGAGTRGVADSGRRAGARSPSGGTSGSSSAAREREVDQARNAPAACSMPVRRVVDVEVEDDARPGLARPGEEASRRRARSGGRCRRRSRRSCARRSARPSARKSASAARDVELADHLAARSRAKPCVELAW